jgi:hypothetical protein
MCIYFRNKGLIFAMNTDETAVAPNNSDVGAETKVHPMVASITLSPGNNLYIGIIE